MTPPDSLSLSHFRVRDNFLDEYLRTLPEYDMSDRSGTTMSWRTGEVPVAKMAERMNTKGILRAQCTTS